MIVGIYHVFGELVVAHEVTLAAAITNLKRQLAICTVTKTPFTVCIPFLGIARPKSQFPHSCVGEQFIYSKDWFTYFLQQRRQIDYGNI
jgi:hypothetical protein